MEAALRVSLGLAGGLALLLRNSWDSNATRTQDSLRQLRGGGGGGLVDILSVAGSFDGPSLPAIPNTEDMCLFLCPRAPWFILLDSSRELIPEPADRVAGVLTDHKPNRPGPGSAKKKKIPALACLASRHPLGGP